MISDDDCKPCKPNTYSYTTETTDPECTKCPVGKYNRLYGSSSSAACTTCTYGYLNWNCQLEEDMELMGKV